MEFAASAVGAKLVTLNSGQGLWQIEHRNGVIMNEDKPEHIAEVAGFVRDGTRLSITNFLQDYKTCRWILATRFYRHSLHILQSRSSILNLLCGIHCKGLPIRQRGRII